MVWSGVESTRPGTRDEMMPEQGPTSREGQSQNRQNRQNRQAKGRRRDAQQMRAKDRPAVVTTKHVGSAWSGAERTRPGTCDVVTTKHVGSAWSGAERTRPGSRARADELRRTEPEQPEQAQQAQQAEHADQATQGPAERDATEERRGESQRSRYEDERICVERQREGQPKRSVHRNRSRRGYGRGRSERSGTRARPREAG